MCKHYIFIIVIISNQSYNLNGDYMEIVKEPVHLVTKRENIAPLVLMPGDPLRAKYIAEHFLDNYILVNDVRNMLAYTGNYKGKRISIVSSGMGIPSSAIYIVELYKFFNVEKIIRIGTCGSINKDCKVRDLLLASASYSPSNFTYIWNKEHVHIAYPNRNLNNVIKNCAKNINVKLNEGNIVTNDVFCLYQDIKHTYSHIINSFNPYGLEMESFGLFYLSNYFNKESACLCTVVDSEYESEIMSPDEKEMALNDMIKVALDAIIK